ncbi:RecA/RadA recombinase [Pseudoalteromonas luteoviolacea B = ATCC 29581]|nr:RecA/RadA recombinase [Pseudoalteromonas luteoviolacea B = ATCC 29581]
MNKLIDLLTHRHLVWQGNREQPAFATITSGFDTLDHALAGGFPAQGVMELESAIGIGELRLLLPSLAKQVRLVVFINPPAEVHAHALLHAGISLERVLIIRPKSHTEALWAAEWCAKSAACVSVLLWHGDIEIHQVKRLQMAAQSGESQVWLLRHAIVTRCALPWTLSLSLQPAEQGLMVQVNKCKGGRPSRSFYVNFNSHWQDLTVPIAHQAEIVPFESLQQLAQ